MVSGGARASRVVAVALVNPAREYKRHEQAEESPLCQQEQMNAPRQQASERMTEGPSQRVPGLVPHRILSVASACQAPTHALIAGAPNDHGIPGRGRRRS